jgi:hypothetical protein
VDAEAPSIQRAVELTHVLPSGKAFTETEATIGELITQLTALVSDASAARVWRRGATSLTHTRALRAQHKKSRKAPNTGVLDSDVNYEYFTRGASFCAKNEELLRPCV